MTPEEILSLWQGHVARAAHAFESSWTWGTLARSDPELAIALREQRDLFAEMCVVGNAKDIAEHGAAMVRGYNVAVKTLKAKKAKTEELRAAAKAAPCLQTLVADFGGYDRITPEAWEDFERRKLLWRIRLRHGDFDTLGEADIA